MPTFRPDPRVARTGAVMLALIGSGGCTRSGPLRVSLQPLVFFATSQSAPGAWDVHNEFEAFPRRTGDSVFVRVGADYHQPRSDEDYTLTCRVEDERDSLSVTAERRITLRADSSRGAWTLRLPVVGPSGWWPAAEYQVACDVAQQQVTGKFRVEGQFTDSIWHGPENLIHADTAAHPQLVSGAIAPAIVWQHLYHDSIPAPSIRTEHTDPQPFDAASLAYVHLVISFGSARLPYRTTFDCTVRGPDGGAPARAHALFILTPEGDYLMVSAGSQAVGGWRAGTWTYTCEEGGSRFAETRFEVR